MSTECKTQGSSAACCCVDVGSVIDNSELSVNFSQVYASQAEAEEALRYLTEKAEAAASEPCKITHRFTSLAEGVELSAEFEFAYQVELMIFQLSTR